ncbi:glycosyltransferase family 1 protein [Azoarcus sp. CIB]|uniref:glycosyltransferase family 4 protein n=1 Tax=Aromatoleum sp. (strain CIB) TaxID=198107 RepID=UPI00067CE74D|nr:glycosyltransferase family 1 protein [Azoarcus sp. CIB]
MKVILSIDPIRYPLTGIGRYTYELARQLEGMPEISDLRYFGGSSFRAELPSASVGRAQADGIRRRALKSRVAVGLYRLVAHRLKARTLRGFESYVFHGPNFYLPAFDGCNVLTVHDLSPYTWAHCHPPERVRYMQGEIERSLARARMLITDSEFTRRELADYFSWPIERIRAVPLASASEFHIRDSEELAPVLNLYGLAPGRYCLYAGTIEPRKNVSTLLDAYAALSPSVLRQWPLVLVGYEGWRSEEIHARIREAQAEGWVRYLGFVPADHLPVLYSGARLFAFPSLYEGFGLPVLEAMASGVPVVCSDSSSLPEVVGEAAATCSAKDVDTLAGLIARGLEDEVWRRDAIEKGLQRARCFSWQRCAQETVAAYRAAVQF